jgi:hypothetical protein
VANHPNSFLDAIIIGAFFKKRVHFLARGDAFHKPWHAKLLRALSMIPVYRLSEGKENLHLNEVAFKQSKELLEKNGIVLVFIEGICVQQHALQPFKKGAGKMLMENSSLPGLRVLPVGIAYHSFREFGKEINLQAGEMIPAKQFFPNGPEISRIKAFNEKMENEISKIIELPQRRVPPNNGQKICFTIAGIPGLLIHAPLYFPLKKWLLQKTRGTVFFDSVLFGILLLLYPLYLFLLAWMAYLAGLNTKIILASFLLLPLLALAAIEFRRILPAKKREIHGN